MEEKHEIVKKVTYPSLDSCTEKEIKAITLKWACKTAAEIGAETGFAETYVRRLFSHDGRLRPALEEFRRKQEPAEDRVQKAIELAENELLAIVQRLKKILHGQNVTASLKASEILLKLTGVYDEKTHTVVELSQIRKELPDGVVIIPEYNIGGFTLSGQKPLPEIGDQEECPETPSTSA